MINIVRNSNQYHYAVNHYQVDTLDERDSLSKRDLAPGSEVYVISKDTTYYLDNDHEWKVKSGGGSGSGAVESVNGKTGAVVLTAADVGALASDTPIPTAIWEAGTGANSVQTIGNNSKALGEASVAEGAEVDAHSYASHAEGYMTSTGTSADYSHAEGYKTTTQGIASHAEGDNTVTNNAAEHAEGKYNKSNTGTQSYEKTIHSVGIGNASSEIPGGARKNAFEIMESGDAYLVGVGNYDGTNPSDSRSVQEIITGLKTYQAMPDVWLDAYSFGEFVQAIYDDESAIPGMAYLGTVGFNGLPPALGSAECIVEIISGDEHDKIALIKLNSADTPPYNWEYNTFTEDFEWREMWSIPKAPEEDGTFKLAIRSEDGFATEPHWEPDIDLKWLPDLPEEDGSYVLKLDIVDGEIDARWARND